ncbi:MAG: peptide/nickel transport system substrate-binding protein [Pseudomonadota bacterium]|nr:peptide/nickel transport system substrate-binding protein [Pseudomonadota bacterium]
MLLTACGEVWNDPYPAAERGQSILYSAFTERPKHLDPVQSYTEDEITFTAQVYEPPLQYHYLKRPYTLVPLTTTAVPVPRYVDAAGKTLPADAPVEKIAESIYEIRLQPGIRYQPHPAFATDASGKPVYADLDRDKLKGIERIADFKASGSRELRADDYIYEIKRLAHPRLHSPIFGMMAEHIVGLKELGSTLQAVAKNLPRDGWLDLDAYPLSGVSKVDDYTYRVRLKGKYPQFLYWLAMPFFAPVPREVDRFYSQPGMAEKNLTLDWYPVGTGPYMLVENNPNSRMVLARNPNFRGETYPCEGEAGDREAGLLEDCGKTLPFIERAIFSREKEAIPYWNKFLQGWYDASGISSDSFDQAVRINVGGDVALTDEMLSKGIRLLTSVRASTFYMGFNMLDPVVGGDKSRKLRQAISIVLDQEEFISIFMNGRGIPAQGPLPPGIFGYVDGEAGINRVVYEWRDGAPRRRSTEAAAKLLAEAGWPNGRDAKTGEPLVLNLDTTGGGMGDKSRLDWLTRQFSKIGIQLVVRSTDFNRFQEKIRKGAVQLYYLGWNADYPDPENFMFLLNGAEGKVEKGGENASNYRNAEFDRLFLEMKNMENGARRLSIITRMNSLLHEDAPWVYGFHPKSYSLGHAWLKNRKPSDVGHNNLKYQRLDVESRASMRREWNRPVLWPLVAGVIFLLALIVPAMVGYRRRERSAARHER